MTGNRVSSRSRKPPSIRQSFAREVFMDYHLLKRKKKGGKIVYYAAFLSDLPGKNGKRQYRAIKSTGVGNRALAHKIARQMLEDRQVLASQDLLRDFLLTFWDPEKSEYLRSARAEGRTHAAAYLTGNRSTVDRYFLPYCDRHGITKLASLTRQNLLAWRNELYESGVGPRG